MWGARSVQRFDVYWIQKKQTNSQAKYIYIENQLKLEELKFIPLINITINPVLKNPGINPAFIVFTVKERKWL